jgi:type IV pilus assembly protein PilN
MRITLNLATRPFTDLGPAIKRLRIAMAALAVLCIIFLLGLHLFDRQAEAVRAREHSLDGQIARVQAERAAAEAMMQQPDNARLVNQAEFLNQRFDEKAFSWTLAMEAMEIVLPGGVQVTSIEPLRDKDGHITVHVRVVGPRDRADELVSNLERSPRFLQPRIVGENAESGNGPSRILEPISASSRFDFDLLADYNPPTPEERASLKRAAKPSAKLTSSTSLGIEKPARKHGAPTVQGQPGRKPYTEPSPSKPPASGPSSFFRNPTHGGPQ